MLPPINPSSPVPPHHVKVDPSPSNEITNLALAALKKKEEAPQIPLPPVTLLTYKPPDTKKTVPIDYAVFQLMHGIGYRSDEYGICAGLADMGGQAILAGDFKTYEGRLERIAQLIQKYRDQGGDLQEAIRKDRKTLEKDYDLLAFFDGLELYHQMNFYPHLSNKMPPSNIHVKKSLEVVNKMGLSEAVQNQGGIGIVGTLIGFYTKDELTQYFELFKPLFIKKETFVLTLEVVAHRIKIGYDKKENSWILIDNSTSRVKTNEELAQMVYRTCLEPDQSFPYVALATYMQTTNDHLPSLKTAFETLENNKTFQSIQTLSKEKLDCIRQGETSFLDLALTEKDTAAFQFLVDQKVDLNTRLESGATIIEKAILAKNLEAVKLLLKHGADPNLPNKEEYTALDVAIYVEDLQIIELLPNRNRLLHLATQKGDKDLVAHLLNLGADVNASLGRGSNTPLRLAVTSGNEDMVKFLMSKGAHLHYYGEDKDLLFSSLQDNPKILEILIEKGADVNSADREGNTLLMQAVGLGNLLLAQFLLDYGADPTKANKAGDTPLHIAAAFGHDELVLVLFKKSDINSPNRAGHSPLYLAKQNKRASTARILQQAGAKLPLSQKIKFLFE